MLAQQPEGSERLTPGLRPMGWAIVRPMGWAIVPGVAPSGRISGRDRLPAGPVEVVPDQAGGSRPLDAIDGANCSFANLTTTATCSSRSGVCWAPRRSGWVGLRRRTGGAATQHAERRRGAVSQPHRRRSHTSAVSSRPPIIAQALRRSLTRPPVPFANRRDSQRRRPPIEEIGRAAARIAALTY
jgi:hypothetical protein